MGKNSNNISAYLYDADGSDQEVEIEKGILQKLAEKQLLWIDICGRDESTIREVIEKLCLKNVPLKTILRSDERPVLDKFDDFYRFMIVSVALDEDGELFPLAIDFLAAKNFVITIHNEPISYFDEFRNQEKGETRIGELDSESFVATLLDLHIVSYFRVLEKIEMTVDTMDEQILSKDLEDEHFFRQTVKLRSYVSKLRRCILPHREIFYALSRPDFNPAADSDTLENFRMLNDHFQTAIESIESSREAVISLFDLYTSKTSHRMNHSMKRLTFITLLVGGMGVIAGALGMNFKEDFFDVSDGFWVAISAMILIAGTLILIAWRRRWI